MDDVAILHDQFETFGGAERVAIPLARAFDAPIYTMVGRHEAVPDDIDIREIGGRAIAIARKLHYNIEDVLHMLNWQHVPELYDFDVIIETKTNPYWFVPKDDQVVIRYNHSTPRNLYDQHWRRGSSRIRGGLKIIQRMLYQQTLPYADRWVANSDLVRRRMQLYWDIDADVVYPPVDINAANPDRRETGDYYLHLGRLDTNKRIGVLRDVAELLNAPVIVAGEGDAYDELRPLPDNLDYRGYVTAEEKWDLYAGAKATLFLAENEDFGIVPIESLASGTPVIGPREGFTQYQIRHGENGHLVDDADDATAVASTVDVFSKSGVKWTPEEMVQYAAQFSTDRFTDRMQTIVEEAVADAAIETNLATINPTPGRARHG